MVQTFPPNSGFQPALGVWTGISLYVFKEVNQLEKSSWGFTKTVVKKQNIVAPNPVYSAPVKLSF